ncbi:IclR family transcriptional regulator [Alkalihalobacillus sp. MEB130]|uniref:IclR family transcriptional regulator n=1 Tax=Alkalihalobacillus sp. MEB130 TaxID=2976704 RepID=UPI0028DFBFFF|nr:IclR family transcriptional regulator [Alkalihalobacillus sp. MEB130]MDT8859700.1 IclR family transcriptional regulator [Alkalihalobacillus sp. MEB130]
MRYPAINNESYSSMRNALRLLNLFTIEEPELNLSEIADKLQIAHSTAHRLTNTLLHSGLLVKEPIMKTYRPASSILSMGNIFLKRYRLSQYSIPILEELTKKTGETAHISILKDNKVVYLYKVDSLHPVHLLSHAGRQNPVHCTSSGQAILAYQPDREIQAVIEKGLEAYTAKTITSPNEFIKTLANIRYQGYAVSNEELHHGVTSIAAPIYSRGRVVASVSIAGPTTRISQLKAEVLIKLVKVAATKISDSTNEVIK